MYSKDDTKEFQTDQRLKSTCDISYLRVLMSLVLFWYQESNIYKCDCILIFFIGKNSKNT